MASLTYLSIERNNGITGRLPTTLNMTKSLVFLSIPGNGAIGSVLTGTIPSTLFLLSRLTYLRLSGNSLTGSLPSLVSKMSSLVRLDLGHNLMTGTLPTTLGVVPLGYLDMSFNFLIGVIPSSLTKPKTLILSYNFMTGAVPAGLTASSLHLSRNRFTSFRSNFCYSNSGYCVYCPNFGSCCWSYEGYACTSQSRMYDVLMLDNNDKKMALDGCLSNCATTYVVSSSPTSLPSTSKFALLHIYISMYLYIMTMYKCLLNCS